LNLTVSGVSQTFLFAHYQAQRTERIRDTMTKRYINLLFTCLFS